MDTTVLAALISAAVSLLAITFKELLTWRQGEALAKKYQAETQSQLSCAQSNVIRDLRQYIGDLKDQVDNLQKEVASLRQHLQILHRWIETLPDEIRNRRPEVEGE